MRAAKKLLMNLDEAGPQSFSTLNFGLCSRSSSACRRNTLSTGTVLLVPTGAHVSRNHPFVFLKLNVHFDIFDRKLGLSSCS